MDEVSAMPSLFAPINLPMTIEVERPGVACLVCRRSPDTAAQGGNTTRGHYAARRADGQPLSTPRSIRCNRNATDRSSNKCIPFANILDIKVGEALTLGWLVVRFVTQERVAEETIFFQSSGIDHFRAAVRAWRRNAGRTTPAPSAQEWEPVVSGHKSSSCSWLPSSMWSNWEPMSKTAIEMGVFSKMVTLKICRSL